MFTAREMTSPSRDQRDDRLDSHHALGHRRQRHRVGRRERRRVRQRHIQVVEELRPPEARLDAIVGHLREQEVGGAVVPSGATAGAAAVDLPVPQREDQEVRQPDQHPRDDQLVALGDVVVQQPAAELDEREDVGGAHKCGQRDRGAPACRVLVLELARRGHRQADQQHALERRHQPCRADRQALGEADLQADRDQHRHLDRPERLCAWRWWIGTSLRACCCVCHERERRERLGGDRCVQRRCVRIRVKPMSKAAACGFA